MIIYKSAIEPTIAVSVTLNNIGTRFPIPCISIAYNNEPATANGFIPIPSKIVVMFEGYNIAANIITRIMGIKYTIPTISTLIPEANMPTQLLKAGRFILPVSDDFIIFNEYPYTNKTSKNPIMIKSPISALF